MFENRVLRRIFGPKRDEVTREWRTLHHEGFNDFCSSTSNVIKPKAWDWSRIWIVRGERRGVYRVHVHYMYMYISIMYILLYTYMYNNMYIIEPLLRVSALPAIFRIPFGTTNIPDDGREHRNIWDTKCVPRWLHCVVNPYLQSGHRTWPPPSPSHIRPLASFTTIFLRIILV